MKNDIILYTDGSSLGNPGPGGWGVLIIQNNNIRELGGKAEYTTNNKMELFAIIEGLRAVKNGENLIKIYTDSNYAINGITKWIHGWKKNGWKTATKKPVENQNLWEALYAEIQGEKIEWKHVPGHAGIAGNERANDIAQAFASEKNMELYSGPKEKYAYSLNF